MTDETTIASFHDYERGGDLDVHGARVRQRIGAMVCMEPEHAEELERGRNVAAVLRSLLSALVEQASKFVDGETDGAELHTVIRTAGAYLGRIGDEDVGPEEARDARGLLADYPGILDRAGILAWEQRRARFLATESGGAAASYEFPVPARGQ